MWEKKYRRVICVLLAAALTGNSAVMEEAFAGAFPAFCEAETAQEAFLAEAPREENGREGSENGPAAEERKPFFIDGEGTGLPADGSWEAAETGGIFGDSSWEAAEIDGNLGDDSREAQDADGTFGDDSSEASGADGTFADGVWEAWEADGTFRDPSSEVSDTDEAFADPSSETVELEGTPADAFSEVSDTNGTPADAFSEVSDTNGTLGDVSSEALNMDDGTFAEAGPDADVFFEGNSGETTEEGPGEKDIFSVGFMDGTAAVSEAGEEDEFLSGEAAELLQAGSTAELREIYEATGKLLAAIAEEYPPVVASTNGEWQILGLARSGQAVDASLYSRYRNTVEDTVTALNGVLHERKYTEYSRVVLALTAIGEDVTDVGGYNLLQPLSDFDQTVWQGINGAIFALIAFDSHDYEIPAAEPGKVQTTRENLIEHILSLETSGGGWALSGNSADADITAMAIQALAPYYAGSGQVKAAVDRGLEKLSSMQGPDGGFSSWESANSESCSQTITALAAMGIDPLEDARFIKNGKTVLDGLLTFAAEGGGFCHVPGGSVNQMSTEQAYYALTAYFRFVEGKTFLYDMTDVMIRSDREKAEEVIRQIEALPGVVTLQDKTAVRAALAAYNALSGVQKEAVSEELAAKLENAVNTLEALEVQNVIDRIASIGKVTLEEEGQISEINAAYHALSQRQQEQVSNYALLAAAVDALYELRHPPKPSPAETPSPTPLATPSPAPVPTQVPTVTPAGGNGGNGNSGGNKTTGGSTKTVSVPSRSTSASAGSTGGGKVSEDSAKSDGMVPEETERAKSVLEELRELLAPQDGGKGLPDRAEDYTDAQMDAVLRIYRAGCALTAQEKLAVEQSEYYQEFCEALVKLGEYNHMDAACGVNLLENGEDALPWYIRLVASPRLAGTEQLAAIREVLGEESEVFSLSDIHFVNLLDGEDWHPQEIVKVKIPMVDLGNYENAVVVHIKDDGTLEFLKGNVSGDYLEFDAAEFSIYGIAGLMGPVEELLKPREDSAALWPWIAAGGGAGVLLLLLGIYLAADSRRRRKRITSAAGREAGEPVPDAGRGAGEDFSGRRRSAGKEIPGAGRNAEEGIRI